MILPEDGTAETVPFNVYFSKINVGEISVGDPVFVYKTISGLEDLKVHKGVPAFSDKVHYFFNHELGE